VSAKIETRDVPPETFQCVHMDHVKIPKNASHWYTHALVLIDAKSLYCELIPVKSTSATKTCRAILREWISHYFVFSKLVTNRHTSFTGKLTKMLTKPCGIHHTLISAYHSRSNGHMECMNELLLQGIRMHCHNKNEWLQLLPTHRTELQGRGCTWQGGVSPFQILYGENMRLP